MMIIMLIVMVTLIVVPNDHVSDNKIFNANSICGDGDADDEDDDDHDLVTFSVQSSISSGNSHI